MPEETAALSGKSISNDSLECELRAPAVPVVSDYELVRYPSGQLIITKITKGSSFRDVVGAFTSELEATNALKRLDISGK
jgi:hypothetical protein